MAPEDLRLDHQTADHFAFLKAHDRGGHSPFLDDVTGWAWLLFEVSSRSRTLSHNIEPLAGRGHAALPLMALEVVRRIGRSAQLHLVTDQTYFNDMINAGRESRQSRDYRKTNGEPYANAESWRDLDDAASHLEVRLSAGRPQSSYATRGLFEASRHASRAARNVGNKPGDWEP